MSADDWYSITNVHRESLRLFLVDQQLKHVNTRESSPLHRQRHLARILSTATLYQYHRYRRFSEITSVLEDDKTKPIPDWARSHFLLYSTAAKKVANVTRREYMYDIHRAKLLSPSGVPSAPPIVSYADALRGCKSVIKC
jgi:hypothetical protein